MSRFQACIGPGASRAHIRDTHSDSPLVLCEATVWVQMLRGRLDGSAICMRCLRKMVTTVRMDEGKPYEETGSLLTAEMIGVTEIY